MLINLNEYIYEKLHLNKDIEVTDYKNFFTSHVTDNPYEFNDVNYIVGSWDFKKSRFSIFMEYVKEILKEGFLYKEEDIEFANEWLDVCKSAYKIEHKNTFAWLCNGKKPYFGNAKFIYDVIKYALSKEDLSIPRKQKLEKMLRDDFSTVEKHKDEMNWY